MKKTFTRKLQLVNLLFSLIILSKSYQALAGEYRGSAPSFSFTIRGLDCTDATITISNITVKFTSRSAAEFSSTISGVGSPFTYSSTSSINGNSATFSQSGDYVYCPPDNASRRGPFQATLSNINFTGANRITCTLSVRITGAFTGSGSTTVTLDFAGSLPRIILSNVAGCAGNVVTIDVSGDSPRDAIVKARGSQIGTLPINNSFSFNYALTPVPYVLPNVDNQGIAIDIETPYGNSGGTI